MRFAITANDRYLGIFEALVSAGWTPLKLFSAPTTHELSNQHAVIAYAERCKASIQLSRMTERDLRDLHEQGCEALVVASYDHKICDWRPFLKYAVNFHCSPLPLGRGPYPVMRAILENHRFWGVTCHQLGPGLDEGDILDAEHFPLQPDECHESLDLKIQMAAKRLAARLAGQFAEKWEQARPQGTGSYWNKPEMKECVIDFHRPVEAVMRHIRAYGAMESLAYVNNKWVIVKRAVGWTEKHRHAPGHVAHVFNRSIVVAAPDGYIGLLESSLAPPDVVAGINCLLTKAANRHAS